LVADRQLVIAIDGPASSGKSVLGEALARRLGYLYFDTGALYRAVTWLALHVKVDVSDEDEVARLARESSIAICRPTAEDGRQYTVLVNGEDVTWGIISPAVDASVSVVAAHPAVRSALLDVQRIIAAPGGVVMVGRDIGTVVVPNADLKVYLDATPEVRARRRLKQMVERGQAADYEQVLENVRLRDRIDSGRAAAPLKAAPDAVVVDTSDMAFEDEMALVLRLVEEKRAAASGEAG
jgi:CMP/dCMP kinase